MNHPLLLALEQDPDLAQSFDIAFDFRLCKSAKPDWFKVSSSETFLPVAEDATGSVFLVGLTTGRLLLATSEGLAGVVAQSVKELFSLMATHPFWRDLLKFSGNGKLTEMYRAAPFLYSDFLSDGSLEEHRRFAITRLHISPNSQAIDLLHQAVEVGGKDVSVTATDGTMFDSLFNRFTVESNALWHAE